MSALVPRVANGTGIRIVHCIQTVAAAMGGMSSYVRSAVVALKEHGVCAELATLDGSAAELPVAEGELPSIPDHRESGGWWSMYRAVQRADVVHLHGLFSVFAGGVFLLCRLLRKPYVITVHGQLGAWCLEQSKLRKKVFFAVLGRSMLRLSRGVVVLSAMEQVDVTQQVGGVRVVVAPPALPPPPSPAPSSARSAPTALRVLFLSRLHPVKRIELLVRALADVNRKVDATLDIAGEGDHAYLIAVRAAIADSGVSARVRFHGFVEGDRKAALFLHSDVFVLPSAHENFSIAAAEAMSFGLPVILSREVAISADVAEAGAGICLDTTTAQSIAQALLRLVDPVERNRMAVAGRALATRFSAGKLSSALGSAYQFALSAASRDRAGGPAQIHRPDR